MNTTMFKNTTAFLKKQTANIIVTILGGLIPLIVNWIIKIFKKQDINDVFIISPEKNYIFQSIFVLVTLYVLIQVRRYVVNDISNSEEQIKQYIRKNCGLRIFNREETSASAFRTVQETAHQFFNTWLVVWLMWLVYYGGGLFLTFSLNTYNNCCNNMVLDIYQQVFDFFNSTAMFAIYIILTNVTVNRKVRNHNEYAFLDSILAWAILLIVFIAGIIVENCAPRCLFAKIIPFYVSAISAITFVLLLGKMNSSYLKIPSIFMLFLYLYAIIQLYIPFRDLCIQNNCWLRQFLCKSLPYITLLGKFFLMLTICWIAVQRRFIFYVIHRSTTIDKIDDLMSELNKENVSF